MKLKKIYDNIRSEQQLLSENNGKRFQLLHYDNDYNEHFEEYGLDEYEVADDANRIAIDGGVTILNMMELSGILVDVKLSKVIGGIWVSHDSEKFSFDIAIDSNYQGMGLGTILIDAALQEYGSQKEVADEMDNEFNMEVDVINPKLAEILEKKYGFHILYAVSQDRVIMGLK